MRSLKYWAKLNPLLIAGLLLAACGGGSGQFTTLTSEKPLVQTAEGFTLSVNPSALSPNFGVQINSRAADSTEAEWSQALQVLPANLHLQSQVFEIRTTGTPPSQAFLSLIIPSGSDSTLLDLYAWGGGEWRFLPAHERNGQLVAKTTEIPEAVALFAEAPVAPAALVAVEPGQALTPEVSGVVNAVLLGGVLVRADGTLTGQLPGVTPNPSFALYPTVGNYDSSTGNTSVVASLFTDPTTRVNHIQQLVSLALSGQYAGLALDYRGLGADLKEAYAAFVADVAAQLHARGKSLMVRVELPQFGADGSAATGGYDWASLGAAADALLIPMPLDPTVYGNGQAAQLLDWAVGEVSPNRLRLVTSALSVESSAQGYKLRTYPEALALLGSATLTLEATPQAGQAITLTLSGQAQALDYDAAAFSTRYAYTDEVGPHLAWLTTADTLRGRFTLAQRYHLGGVVITDWLTPGVPADFASAVGDYRVKAGEAAAQASLLWTVSNSGQVVAQATAQPGQPYVYVAQAPGAYQISAELHSTKSIPLGSVDVNVAEAAPTATPPAVAASTGGSGSTTGDTGGTGSTDGSSGGGGFVPPPPVTSGSFELGGQVPGFIGHPTEMKQAGMTWVKFQATGDAGGFISAAHAAGFKVLLSAVGDHARAADPNYWPEYAGWVAGMAAQGADAIEIWNEANIDREWPTGQISGATYTELLKQAYNAIKGVNGNTIVISGAPAPTGAEAAFPGRVMNDNNFLAQMAAAGAASYMDCVGVHYNEGVVSPTQGSGDPRDNFYSRYYPSMVDLYYGTFQGTRQLCFTELGYLTPEGYGTLPGFFAWAGDNSVAEQAQWLAEAASLSASSGQVRLMIVFNVDFTLWGDDPQAGYAMMRPGGTCPACAALDAVMP